MRVPNPTGKKNAYRNAIWPFYVVKIMEITGWAKKIGSPLREHR